MTTASELRELGTEELQVHLASAKAEIFNLRFQYATGQFDRTHRFKELKREIARILTILGERAVEEAEARVAAPSGDADASERTSLRGRWRARRAARSAGLAAAEAESAEHAGENVEISVAPQEHDHHDHDHDHGHEDEDEDDELAAEALAAGAEDDEAVVADDEEAEDEAASFDADAATPNGLGHESEAEEAPDSKEEKA